MTPVLSDATKNDLVSFYLPTSPEELEGAGVINVSYMRKWRRSKLCSPCKSRQCTVLLHNIWLDSVTAFLPLLQNSLSWLSRTWCCFLPMVGMNSGSSWFKMEFISKDKLEGEIYTLLLSVINIGENLMLNVTPLWCVTTIFILRNNNTIQQMIFSAYRIRKM